MQWRRHHNTLFAAWKTRGNWYIVASHYRRTSASSSFLECPQSCWWLFSLAPKSGTLGCVRKLIATFQKFQIFTAFWKLKYVFNQVQKCAPKGGGGGGGNKLGFLTNNHRVFFFFFLSLGAGVFFHCALQSGTIVHKFAPQELVIGLQCLRTHRHRVTWGLCTRGRGGGGIGVLWWKPV